MPVFRWALQRCFLLCIDVRDDMNISAHTLETLQRLPSQDASLLERLYAAQSLEQAVEIVADSAQRLQIAIDRGELTLYLQSALTIPAMTE
ncbi:hypothetical protein PT7_0975 [Pusillimonas sp. T7-7]|nr:hypothetical protein PT7_0975 [Pusillimonas sp. T7-7]